MLDLMILARVLHILGVVVWIGGVAMVTLVILPAVREIEQPKRRISTFEAIEGRFATVAKIATVLVGATGLYMLYKTQTWILFTLTSHWWMHAMVLVWAAFTLVLFVLEPLFLHRWFQERAKTDPERTFRIMQVFHWVLLTASMLTIAGAMAGAHGWFLL